MGADESALLCYLSIAYLLSLYVCYRFALNNNPALRKIIGITRSIVKGLQDIIRLSFFSQNN